MAKLLFPYKNWTQPFPVDRLNELYANPYFQRRIKKKTLACISCFAGDKEILELTEGEYKGLVLHTSSFINAIMLGSRLGIEDYGEAMKLSEILDEYGLCMLTFSSLADFLIDLCERGIITEKETGLSLRRDFDSLVNLVEKIVYRDGFGNTLADGWLETIKRIGRGCERYASIIKGMDYVFDGRLCGVSAFEHVVCPGGPRSAWAPAYAAADSPDRFRRLADRKGMPEEAIGRALDSPVGVSQGRYAKYEEDWLSLFNCLGICGRAYINRYYNAPNIAEIYSQATGIELSPSELLRASERSFTLWKAFCAREGFSRKDDVIPEQWFETMRTAEGEELRATDYFGKRAVSREEFEALLDDYYDERGWDTEKGVPTREKLMELGLDDVAQDFSQRGLL